MASKLLLFIEPDDYSFDIIVDRLLKSSYDFAINFPEVSPIVFKHYKITALPTLLHVDSNDDEHSSLVEFDLNELDIFLDNDY